MSPDLERELCLCNHLSLTDVVAIIKEHQITTLEALIALPEYSIGNKCESCLEEGYENDGFSLAMALDLVRRGQL